MNQNRFLNKYQFERKQYDSIKLIYDSLVKNKISVENLVLGMGGALLQKVNRDTQKFAIKCSYAEVGSEKVEVRKSPVEMNEDGKIIPSFKASKAGRIKLINEGGKFKTVNEGAAGEDLLQTVFENGELKKNYTFEEIRERAKVLI